MNRKDFPAPPAAVHLVGIGGIGMSGLAQALRGRGYRVSGSDRALENPENAALFAKLKLQDIALYPQDGSFVTGTATVGALVYSTAIEADNPDFIAGKDWARFHRSEALAAVVEATAAVTRVAVTGSCGKTSVTAWLADALAALNMDPLALIGGMANAFRDETRPGNYRSGKGPAIFEADESDKSLSRYRPDIALVLNASADHYPLEEVREMFGAFVAGTRAVAVVEASLAAELKRRPSAATGGPRTVTFADAAAVADADWTMTDYRADGQAVFHHRGQAFPFVSPIPGRHNALNALAVVAALETLDVPIEKRLWAAARYRGVERRFDYKGKTARGADIYDDYAHNVEKIASCLRTAGEIAVGRVFGVFQPHGYGPLGFMRADLEKASRQVLRPGDKFIFLPVYYAGGTTGFRPTSREVFEQYDAAAPGTFLCFDSRDEAAAFLKTVPAAGDAIVVMGARDNALPLWAGALKS